MIKAMKNIHKKTLTFQPKQQEIALLSVYLLGGERKSLDTEDIAFKSHDLAPGLFSWRKYPEQINLELVRVALSDAKKSRNGELLIGSGREGWRLSAKGLEWAKTQGKKLLKGKIQASTKSRTAGSIDAVRKTREKDRLISSLAWKSWNGGDSISTGDARTLFRIDEYSTPKMLEIKIVRMQALFDEEEKFSDFLKEAGKIILETGGTDE